MKNLRDRSRGRQLLPLLGDRPPTEVWTTMGGDPREGSRPTSSRPNTGPPPFGQERADVETGSLPPPSQRAGAPPAFHGHRCPRVGRRAPLRQPRGAGTRLLDREKREKRRNGLDASPDGLVRSSVFRTHRHSGDPHRLGRRPGGRAGPRCRGGALRAGRRLRGRGRSRLRPPALPDRDDRHIRPFPLQPRPPRHLYDLRGRWRL